MRSAKLHLRYSLACSHSSACSRTTSLIKSSSSAVAPLVAMFHLPLWRRGGQQQLGIIITTVVVSSASASFPSKPVQASTRLKINEVLSLLRAATSACSTILSPFPSTTWQPEKHWQHAACERQKKESGHAAQCQCTACFGTLARLE
eukprot:scpid38412/ scgid29114/ 